LRFYEARISPGDDNSADALTVRDRITIHTNRLREPLRQPFWRLNHGGRRVQDEHAASFLLFCPARCNAATDLQNAQSIDITMKILAYRYAATPRQLAVARMHRAQF
jgi:hypothetical protein